MATRKKTEAKQTDDGMQLAYDLVEKIGHLHAVIDEIAGNSNYLPDISKSLDRIADALEKLNERSNT